MDNALLLSLSNQMVARRSMDVIANNIANMNTTGFKRESPVFQEYVVNVDREAQFGRKKLPLSFVRDVVATHDMTSGEMATTGNQLDVAIDGDAFFTISTPNGDRYTRNGNFGRDDTGRLVTNTGQPVLDDGGSEIVFAPEETQITIARDGTISTEQGLKGKLGLVEFENPQAMRPVGDSLWESDDPPVAAANSGVVQAMLEKSNVQPVVEMVRMIDIMRSYQNSTELLNANEDLVRRAVQKLGEARA